MIWIVFWAPEGRPIARVEAKNELLARRQAPKPYRQYLGEIYAEVEGQESWRPKEAQHGRPAS